MQIRFRFSRVLGGCVYMEIANDGRKKKRKTNSKVTAIETERTEWKTVKSDHVHRIDGILPRVRDDGMECKQNGMQVFTLFSNS